MGTDIPKSDITQNRITPPAPKGPEVVEGTAIRSISTPKNKSETEPSANNLTARRNTEKITDAVAVAFTEEATNEAWLSNSRAVTV